MAARPDRAMGKATRGVSWGRSRRGVTWGGRTAVVVAGSMMVALVGPQAFAGTVAVSGVANYDPTVDAYSMQATTRATGAEAWWDAGYTGRGVDVAVIDTGVSPVPGLDGPGKVVAGPDLSLDSLDPTTRNLDENGHGTFMAGLIAGHADDLAAPYGAAPATSYAGMAPDARIVSLKVGVADGEVDVTQVIAAIDWVVQHKDSDGLDIKVLSLSYGTNSTQDEGVDPLAYAVERAWDAGIVVVAAAGNTGFQQGAGAPGLADPAYDPQIISVGAYDTMGTAKTGDDSVATFSASSAGCPSCKAPDLLAVGGHLQGLRVPGSYVDDSFPGGDLGQGYFRGSGTSEATALTAGAAALILSRYPDLDPDQVKALLTTTASPMAGVPVAAQGAGELDLTAALDAAPMAAADADAAYSVTPSTGTGSIEGARGSDHVDFNGWLLTGNRDVMLHPVSPSALAAKEATGSAWSGDTWNHRLYVGALVFDDPTSPLLARIDRQMQDAHAWTGDAWAGSTWSGTSWSGSTWSGTSWSGSTWSGSTWSSASWD